MYRASIYEPFKDESLHHFRSIYKLFSIIIQQNAHQSIAIYNEENEYMCGDSSFPDEAKSVIRPHKQLTTKVGLQTGSVEAFKLTIPKLSKYCNIYVHSKDNVIQMPQSSDWNRKPKRCSQPSDVLKISDSIFGCMDPVMATLANPIDIQIRLEQLENRAATASTLWEMDKIATIRKRVLGCI